VGWVGGGWPTAARKALSAARHTFSEVCKAFCAAYK